MPFVNTLAKQLMAHAAAQNLDLVGVCQSFRPHLEGGVKMLNSRLAP
jgi:hypothetical protein